MLRLKDRVDAKMSVPPIKGQWLTGKTNAGIMFNELRPIDTDSAWFMYNMKSSDGHTIAFGGLGNNIGFYTYLSSRTANGSDSSFVCDTSTGNWTCNKRIIATGGFQGDLNGGIYGTLTNPSTDTYYAIPFHASISNGYKTLGNNDGLQYNCIEGTTSVLGTSLVQLGNNKAAGTAGNKKGYLRLFGNSTGRVQLQVADGVTGNFAITLPGANGTVSLTSHTHGLLHTGLSTTIESTVTDKGWAMINSSYNGFILKSLRTQANAPNWLRNNYAAGIAFGGADTKGVLSVAYDTPAIKFAGGNGTTPKWWLELTGTTGQTYNLDNLGGSGVVNVIQASSWDEAIALSREDPNSIYWW